MPVLANCMKCDTNKGDVMGCNEQWSFNMAFYHKRSEMQ